jgi:type IV pilus assembly protein PilA
MSRRHTGFTLIELLIVVAIILVIAAIAIPNLIRSRQRANEASAVASVRSISTAQTNYVINYPTVGYADALAKLGPPPPGTAADSTAAGLLDSVLGCSSQPCLKSGYLFTLTASGGPPFTQFTATAVPASATSGRYGYCITENMKITFDPGGGTNCTQVLQ